SPSTARSPKVTNGALPSPGLLPAGVVTMTGRSLPDVNAAVESGVVAVICVSLSTTNCAGSASSGAPGAAVEPVPGMGNWVAPARGRFVGATAVGCGGAAAGVSGGATARSPKVTNGALPSPGLLPAGVVTMTGRSLPDVNAAVESGVVAVICVSLSTTN